MSGWPAGRAARLFPLALTALLLCLLSIPLLLLAPSAYADTSRPLRVVMDDNYPPYVFRNADNVLEGILPDQWKMWSRTTGRAVEIVATDWGEALRRMEAGEFDVIDTIFRSQAREKVFVFSSPYAAIDVPIFFHEDLSGIRDGGDARGFVVAVKSGDHAIDVLRSKGVETLLEFPSYEAIVAAAAEGRIKVFTIDRPPALYLLHRMGIADRFRETDPIYTGSFHRAVRKGDEESLRAVTYGFSRIAPSEMERIARRWTGSPVFTGISTHHLRLAGLGLLLLATGGVVWLLTLRRAVSARTAELRREMDARVAEERRSLEALLTFQAVFDCVNDAIFIHDGETGRVLDVNRRMTEMYGLTRAEAISITPDRLSAGSRPFSSAEAMEWLRKAREEGPQLFPWMARHSSGRLFPVEVSARFDGTGKGGRFFVTVRDVSERARAEEERGALEEQLRQSQKMEAIGRLAGGVAHDFNNLLTAILGYGEFLSGRLPPGDENAKDLEAVRSAAEMAASLTRQLLAFSRKQILRPRVVQLADVVVDVQRMIGRLLGEDIELAVHVGAGTGSILADPAQLQQVIMNLAVNGRDAMPGGGSLTIETASVEVAGTEGGETVGISPGRYVTLSVSDEGRGMDAETLSHLFEPFFTTKGPGQGTGLGLATVHGIVTQSGGHIRVASDVGKGTTFRIWFPGVDPESAEPEREPEPAPLPRGSETVLVAEDSPDVRALTCRMLRMLGYRVLEAEDGEVALSISRGDATGPIHLLLTDLVMPGMSGRALAETLARECPGLKVAYTTGYSEDVVPGREPAGPRIPLLQKPFRFPDLATFVREVLDGRPLR